MRLFDLLACMPLSDNVVIVNRDTDEIFETQSGKVFGIFTYEDFGNLLIEKVYIDIVDCVTCLHIDVYRG